MTASAQPPDPAMEQAPPRQVRAARRRVQPGLLRTAASFRQPLGSQIEIGAVRGYYIDLRAKAENLRWPPEWWCRHEEQEYIAVSQFGLACYERFVAGEGDDWLAVARRTGEYLIDQQQRQGVRDGGWVHLWAYPHTYQLRPPWLSAMAQGEAASLLVRLYLTSKEPRFADAARRALRPLNVPVSEGGVRASLDGGLFFEELPTQPSSFILNGAMFALWGCYDVAVGLCDRQAGELFRTGVETLDRNIGRWDTGFWSRYDLYPHPRVNVANPFYHRLHVSQLEAMQLLTAHRRFASAIARFERYARSPLNTARAYAAKVAFRIVCPRSARLARGLPWADHPLVSKSHVFG
jgi:heparosan-N-sulfate-glucuronate 5-epimerase